MRLDHALSRRIGTIARVTFVALALAGCTNREPENKERVVVEGPFVVRAKQHRDGSAAGQRRPAPDPVVLSSNSDVGVGTACLSLSEITAAYDPGSATLAYRCQEGEPWRLVFTDTDLWVAHCNKDGGKGDKPDFGAAEPLERTVSRLYDCPANRYVAVSILTKRKPAALAALALEKQGSAVDTGTLGHEENGAPNLSSEVGGHSDTWLALLRKVPARDLGALRAGLCTTSLAESCNAAKATAAAKEDAPAIAALARRLTFCAARPTDLEPCGALSGTLLAAVKRVEGSRPARPVAGTTPEQTDLRQQILADVLLLTPDHPASGMAACEIVGTRFAATNNVIAAAWAVIGKQKLTCGSPVGSAPGPNRKADTETFCSDAFDSAKALWTPAEASAEVATWFARMDPYTDLPQAYYRAGGGQQTRARTEVAPSAIPFGALDRFRARLFAAYARGPLPVEFVRANKRRHYAATPARRGVGIVDRKTCGGAGVRRDAPCEPEFDDSAHCTDVPVPGQPNQTTIPGEPTLDRAIYVWDDLNERVSNINGCAKVGAICIDASDCCEKDSKCITTGGATDVSVCR